MDLCTRMRLEEVRSLKKVRIQPWCASWEAGFIFFCEPMVVVRVEINCLLFEEITEITVQVHPKSRSMEHRALASRHDNCNATFSMKLRRKQPSFLGRRNEPLSNVATTENFE